ncbi:unknown [Butyrivibrio sp. CAG:318]|nr:unknown [Butyrivibrio sp. CAG:318]
MCEIMENMIAEAVNEASNEEKTKAVINMLRLKVDEDEVRKLYPAEFEEGKRRFLEESN